MNRSTSVKKAVKKLIGAVKMHAAPTKFSVFGPVENYYMQSDMNVVGSQSITEPRNLLRD